MSEELPKLPVGWKMKKLSEVCERIFAGGDKPKQFSKFKTDKFYVPIYSNGEKNKGLYGYTDEAKVFVPSITISGRGTIGYSEIRNEPFTPIVRLIVLNPIDEIVDIQFLKNIVSHIDFINSGSSIPQLTVPMIKEYNFPLPPLPEQKQIVSILDKAFAAIDKAKANAEQNLKNAKELFESYLQEVFENNGDSCSKVAIKDITSLVTKGSSPKWQGINYVDVGGIFFLTSKNVGEGELLLSNKKYLDENFNEIQKTSILKRGDVLTNIVGASIGRTAIFDLDETTNINQAVCLMRCREEKVYNYYLMYILNSPFYRNILHDNEVDNARANLSLTFFKNLRIPLPTIHEQINLVEKIRDVSSKTKNLQSIYTQKITELDELKKSILQQAFSGQLTTN